ncbi:MAG: deoxynucleoside kinase [Actinomycetaceae bacterium]|nr:deoxynucleoside kinase [Actinomycetaceae bacterium]MDY6083275.1 deoxynucleoside kinase [Actinomycetaceae bacterium]
MSVVVLGGMIGVGKTTVATMLAHELGQPLYKESVADNKILPLFYTASPQEQEKKRYSFLLQLEFLTLRFRDIKDALSFDHAVMDRSIYEDWYFAKVNTDMGRISPEEFGIYERLLSEMMDETHELPKKSPDLFVYLHASFDTITRHIRQRGRDFEQGEDLDDYFMRLWEGYDTWMDEDYHASPVLWVNCDDRDFSQGTPDAHALATDVSQILSLIDAGKDPAHVHTQIGTLRSVTPQTRSAA